MITVDKNTQAHWLQTGRMPLAGQYTPWLSKYWQKNEQIPAANIQGLSAQEQRYILQTIPSATSISWDATLGHKATLTLTSNATLSAIANPQAGSRFLLYIQQDTTGSHTLSFHTSYKFPGGTPPTLSATPNAIDIIEFEADSNNNLHLVNFIADSK